MFLVTHLMKITVIVIIVILPAKNRQDNRLKNPDRFEVLEPRGLRYNSHYIDSYFTNGAKLETC